MAWFGPDGPEGPRLLHVLLSQHAALLVTGLLSAFNSTQDLGVSMVGPGTLSPHNQQGCLALYAILPIVGCNKTCSRVGISAFADSLRTVLSPSCCNQ
jgi:hypothetical protein